MTNKQLKEIETIADEIIYNINFYNNSLNNGLVPASETADIQTRIERLNARLSGIDSVMFVLGYTRHTAKWSGTMYTKN